MGDDLSLHEAIFTTRSMWRLKPDGLARAPFPRRPWRDR